MGTHTSSTGSIGRRRRSGLWKMCASPLTWTALGVLAAAGCATYPDQATTRRLAEKMVSEDYTAPAPGLLKRLVQDRSQEICSKIGGAKLTQEEAAEVVQLARASMQYPASGK